MYSNHAIPNVFPSLIAVYSLSFNCSLLLYSGNSSCLKLNSDLSLSLIYLTYYTLDELVGLSFILNFLLNGSILSHL